MCKNYDELRHRYDQVCTKITGIATEEKRPAPQLLAVSKTKPADMVKVVYEQGQRDFGENYLQDALPKIEALSTLPDIQWHFIGQIQSNKTQAIASHFAWVHSVYRLKIATRLSAQRPTHLPALNICLQVDIDNEPQKGGVTPDDLNSLAKEVKRLPNIALRGLMCIPKPRASLDEQRTVFEKVAQLQTQLNEQLNLSLDTLSMGMSNDILPAIQAGSTCVRIGSDIFGPRI